MKKSLLLLNAILFSCPFLTEAQINVQWETRYNGTGGNTSEYTADMYVDAAGFVYVTGSCYSAASGYDIVTRKYDNAGGVVWTQTFNGSGNGLDEARALFVDGSGNVYVTGYAFRGGANSDYVTLKYNSAGAIQWNQYYDGGASLFDDARDVAVDGSGNVYVTGSANISATNTNIRTVKYNSVGAQQWVANFSSSGSNLDQGSVLILDGSGNIYVAGNAFNSGEDLNFRIIKYEPTAGGQTWTAQYNGSIVNSYDYPVDMALDGTGNLFVTGYSYNGGGLDDDITTIKINSSGTITGNATYNGSASFSDVANSIQVDAGNNVYVVGRVKNTGTSEDFFVIRYDNSLAELWNDSYNGIGANYDEASDMAIDASGNVYVTGYSYLPASNNDFITIKYDPATGARLWTTRFNGTANNSDQAKVINVDAAGNVYVAGDSKGSGTNTDYSAIKYCQLTTNVGADQQMCAGGSVPFSGTGGTTWLWSPATGLNFNNISNPVANPTSTQTYIVSSTSGSGCTDYDTVTVTVNPLPGPVITPSGPTSFCIGDSVTLTASGFASYTWSTSDTTASITVGSAGTYTVTVDDAMGCSNSTNQSVTVFSLPVVDAGSATPYCVGDSVQLNASGASSFVWNSNPDLSSTTIANPYASPTADGWFYVTGTDANNCSDYDSVFVTVLPLPSTPSNTYIIANMQLVTNNATGNQWYLNGVPIGGATGQTYNIGANGDYWVVYTDANNCSSVNSDTVTVNTWSVNDLSSLYNVVVYPNPNNGVFSLNMDLAKTSDLQFELIDVIGKVVYTSSQNGVTGSFRKSFNFENSPNGMYLLRVTIGEEQFTERIVIR